MKIKQLPYNQRIFLLVLLIIIFHNIYAQGPSYCDPTYTVGTNEGDLINGYQIINSNNEVIVSNLNTGSTSGPSYTYYSSYDAYLTISESYSIKLYSGSYSNYYTAWIDYNYDGDFSDDGEKIGVTYIGSNSSGTIALHIDNDSPTGLRRLRIRCTYADSDFDPCENLYYGEAEDYDVVIKKLLTPNTTSGLPEMYINFSSEFGDYDNDGDFDLCVSGINSLSTNITYLYRNNGGLSFTQLNIGMPQVTYGTCSWCDYNNDGWLDIFLTGDDAGTFVSILYNNNGTGTFTAVNTDITGYGFASHCWGDYNLDGTQDLLITGIYDYLGEDKIEASLWANYGNGQFYKVDVDFPDLGSGTAKFVDYNNDNLPDITITGTDENDNYYTRLFLQETDHIFTEYPVDIVGLKYSSFEWGDYNNDGYSDFLISGEKNNEYYTYIYQNNLNQNFLNTDILPGSGFASVYFKDFNNDGLLDFLTGGTNQYTYLQAAGSNFILNESYYPDYIGIYLRTPVIDINNDNNPDFLLLGLLSSIYSKYFYLNNSTITNNNPSTPSGINVSIRGNYTTISWNPASDDHTPTGRISYNVRLRNATDNKEVIMPLSNLSTGKLKSGNLGNAGYNEQLVIKNLPVNKTYSVQVQSIDDNNAASSFSGSYNFTKTKIFDPLTYEAITSPNGAKFCDLDQNGTYDIIALNGYNLGSIYAEIYSAEYYNDPIGTFSRISTGVNITNGKIILGDYNNDNEIDYLLMGHYYEKDFGSGEILEYFPYFNPITQKAFMNGDGDFGDYDNDGDLDLVIMGNDTDNNYYCLLYQNENGTLTESSISVPACSYGTVKGVDYDNDLDLDLFISGIDVSGNYHTDIYDNTSGVFTDANIQFANFSNTNADWADYNNDGLIDLAISGNDEINQNHVTYIYRNLGNQEFEKVWEMGENGRVMWGDFDNDGMYDLLANLEVYMNIGNDKFEKIEGTYVGVSWGDYDNDGVLDGVGAKIYRNTFNEIINTLPSAPTNLLFEQTGNTVTLSWSAADDTESNDGGLSYNVRLGSSPGAYDIISPCANISTGKLYYPHQGNAGINTQKIIEELEPGDYYWSVQAIDHGYNGGDWAAESTVSVKVIQADFLSDTVCAGLPTNFTDLTYIFGQTIESWSWDFGSLSTSNEQNPSYIFPDAGTYPVKLVVTTSGASDSITKDIIVKPNPIVDFDYGVACIGSQNLLDNTTDANGLNIIEWIWDFGDGVTSNLEEPFSHGYISTGDYDVSLIAIAENGCNDTIQKTVSVFEYPAAVITTSSPLTFCEGDSVKLSVPYNTDYIYDWRLDGISITGSDSSSYVARYNGDFSVQITNSNGNCVSTSVDESVTVYDAPTAPLISADGNLEFCQGGSVILSVTNNPEYKYDWKMNGGAVGTDTSRYVASATGEYSLTVSNSTGCSVEAVDSIEVTVYPAPVLPAVNISGPTTFCEGDSVELSVTYNTDYTYQWENNSSIITGAESNSYKALSSGTYILNISNSSGCVTMTSPVDVTVKPMPYEPVITSDNYKAGECMGETPIKLSVEQEVPGYSYQWYRNGMPVAGETSSNIEDFLTEGDYSLEADLDGCTAESDVVSVYFEDAPDKPFIYTQGPTVWYLTCSEDSATTYRWYCNDKLIEGADDYFYVAGRKMGDYQVSIGNSLGCFTRSDVVTIPTGDTGMDNVDPFEGLKIYPNPSNGHFIAEIENEIFGDLLIKIISQDGKELFNFMFEKTSAHFIAELNISEQPEGYYLIIFDLNKHITVRRIIID